MSSFEIITSKSHRIFIFSCDFHSKHSAVCLSFRVVSQTMKNYKRNKCDLAVTPSLFIYPSNGITWFKLPLKLNNSLLFVCNSILNIISKGFFMLSKCKPILFKFRKFRSHVELQKQLGVSKSSKDTLNMDSYGKWQYFLTYCKAVVKVYKNLFVKRNRTETKKSSARFWAFSRLTWSGPIVTDDCDVIRYFFFFFFFYSSHNCSRCHSQLFTNVNAFWMMP